MGAISYRSEPDAQYIQALAQDLKNIWSMQAIADRDALALYRKRHPIDVAEPSSNGRKVVQALKMGYAGVLIDGDVAVLSPPPTWHVTSIADTYESRRHASKLETWLEGCFIQSQIEPVYERILKDLRVYGRGWGPVFPHPRLWASGRYTELIEEWEELLHRQVKGEDVGKAKLRNAQLREDFKRSEFPIRWRYGDASGIWPVISHERRLPEVIELRRMGADEIRAEFGDDAIPEGRSDNEFDIYVYANWYWTATVIADATPELVRKWRHDMDMNPYVLFEANLWPENPEGLRWKSALYDYSDPIRAYDVIVSDIMANHRENTRTPPIHKFSSEVRGITDPEILGKPQVLMEDWKPGEPIAKWTGEEESLAPVSLLNEQSFKFVDTLRDYILQIALNPLQQGRLLSGTSAVLFSTALQASQMGLNTYTLQMVQGHRDLARLFMRSVSALNREFPDDPDKVYVSTERAGMVGVGPSDFRGYEHLVQPRLNITLPINRNQQMSLASQAVQLGLPLRWVMEELLNIENADQVIDEAERFEIRKALLQERINLTIALAGRLAAAGVPAPNLATMSERIGALPPAIQQVLMAQAGAAVGPGTQPGSPGAMMQSLSNEGRAGVPQEMSQTVAQQMPIQVAQ